MRTYIVDSEPFTLSSAGLPVELELSLAESVAESAVFLASHSLLIQKTMVCNRIQ
jgi:hypothetical protein